MDIGREKERVHVSPGKTYKVHRARAGQVRGTTQQYVCFRVLGNHSLPSVLRNHFAKILLDKVARALEFAFGAVRSKPLDSHDDLEKYIGDYASSKGLLAEPELLDAIRQCKHEISDHRDYQIAHDKSPRTMRATMFSLDGSQIRMGLNKIYPKESDAQVESIPLDELAGRIDRYLDLVLKLIETNVDKFALKRSPQPEHEKKPNAADGR